MARYCLLTGLLFCLLPAVAGSDPPAAPSPVREAAVAFYTLLTPAQRQQAVYAPEDTERFRWFYTPVPRKGLPLKAMTFAQRRAAYLLLRSALSAQGYLKATHIMQLEAVLAEMEQNPVRRDPENYFFTLFGNPTLPAPWGWRVEGHHLSLHFTLVDDTLAVTPAFYGTNPAEVRQGPLAGFRVLAQEEDLGRQLLAMLSREQRQRATLPGVLPGDVTTTNQHLWEIKAYAGLPASAMTAPQQLLLRLLVDEYVHNLRHDLAHRELERIEAAGFERLHFGWAGSDTAGAGSYYRIHGPTVLFEFDNSQNEANHVHTVWRDPTNDFGADLLRHHYQTADHHRK